MLLKSIQKSRLKWALCKKTYAQTLSPIADYGRHIIKLINIKVNV